MIESLHIKNFKCFEDQLFELDNLTLLTGLNGTGKSSVIQSLLLLRQSHQDGFLQDRKLLLQGELSRLGTAKDVLFERADSNEFGFGLKYNGSTAEWLFKYEEQLDETRAEVMQLTSDKISDTVYDTSLFGNNFHYLPSDRIGPQSGFEISDYVVNQRQQLGTKGEYVPHFLARFGYEPEKDLTDTDQRCHSNAEENTLMLQVEAWMGEICPGIRIATDFHEAIDQVGLRYTFDIGGDITNEYRSTNVGFGITYTLPIVVALLASEEDTLVLLENPEAHLHPKGQVKLGELIVRAASCGIQVIVESHSDHILNGIRIAVREKIIKRDKVRLYYLSRPEGTDQLSSKVESPRVEEDGRINDWPEGFFDQFEKSLMELF